MSNNTKLEEEIETILIRQVESGKGMIFATPKLSSLFNKYKRRAYKKGKSVGYKKGYEEASQECADEQAGPDL